MYQPEEEGSQGRESEVSDDPDASDDPSASGVLEDNVSQGSNLELPPGSSGGDGDASHGSQSDVEPEPAVPGPSGLHVVSPAGVAQRKHAVSDDEIEFDYVMVRQGKEIKYRKSAVERIKYIRYQRAWFSCLCGEDKMKVLLIHRNDVTWRELTVSQENNMKSRERSNCFGSS